MSDLTGALLSHTRLAGKWQIQDSAWERKPGDGFEMSWILGCWIFCNMFLSIIYPRNATFKIGRTVNSLSGPTSLEESWSGSLCSDTYSDREFITSERVCMTL